MASSNIVTSPEFGKLKLPRSHFNKSLFKPFETNTKDHIILYPFMQHFCDIQNIFFELLNPHIFSTNFQHSFMHYIRYIWTFSIFAEPDLIFTVCCCPKNLTEFWKSIIKYSWYCKLNNIEWRYSYFSLVSDIPPLLKIHKNNRGSG